MLLTETALSGSSDGNGVSITGVAEGTAYVIVKDAQKDTTLTTIPVTVAAERKVVKVELSKTAITVSKDTPAFDVTATAKIPGGSTTNYVKLWVNVNRNLTNCSGLK